MTFYFVHKKDYHRFVENIVIEYNSGIQTDLMTIGRFFGKVRDGVNFSYQSIYIDDAIKLDNKQAFKLAYILGEDILELIKEYKEWKQKN